MVFTIRLRGSGEDLVVDTTDHGAEAGQERDVLLGRSHVVHDVAVFELFDVLLALRKVTTSGFPSAGTDVGH